MPTTRRATQGPAVGVAARGPGDDPILRELARWTGGIPEDAPERVAGWSSQGWERLQRLVLMHGLAAILAEDLRRPAMAGFVPDPIGEWLAEQEQRIARRVERMAGELVAILERTAARGVEVIPLKGAYLLGSAVVDVSRRPMADLDLLVRPDQLAGLRAALAEVGYVKDPRQGIGPKPESFFIPGFRRVIDRNGENPDNPRPIEVHVKAQRHLWPWREEDDLTAPMWAAAVPGTVLGQPALVPPIELVMEHVAVHATTSLMRGRGRLIQCLDLAGLAEAGAAPTTWITPRLAYPALEVAARVLPAIRLRVDLEALATSSPMAVTRWARRTPLDGRAGLETGGPVIPPRGHPEGSDRWRPSRMRLAVAYGSVPLPEALGRLGWAAGLYRVRRARRWFDRDVSARLRRLWRRILPRRARALARDVLRGGR